MNEKILFVYDEPDILDALIDVLSPRFDIHKAGNGKDALEKTGTGAYDIVLVDIGMPLMNGIELMHHIREVDEHVEIIVLTGCATVETAVKSFRDYRAFDYIQKPLEEPNVLYETIDLALESRRLKAENKSRISNLQRKNEELEIRVAERTEALIISTQALKEARISAEAALRVKSDFLACMSHEFLTPLNHILGYSALIEATSNELDNLQKNNLDVIKKSGKELHKMVYDILQFAKQGPPDLTLSNIDLQYILDKSYRLIKESVIEMGIEYTVDTTNMPKIINADEYKLRQILHVLLSNAVKFNQNNGKICLDVRIQKSEPVFKTEEVIQFSVSDTGTGIESKDLKRIFNPFEQVEEVYTRTHGGAGLGLALARKFVEHHGGKIWAESDGPGKGSVFRFVLPRHP